MKKTLALLALACWILPWSVGCQNPSSQEPTAAADSESADASHDEESHAGHSHDHDDVGPHGGHLLHLSPSDAHAEWTHDDDNHLITVYLDDFDADKIEAAKFVVQVQDQTEEFALTPGDQGWSISSEALMNHINMGEAADVQLVVTDDNGDHTTKIEAHEHHHH